MEAYQSSSIRYHSTTSSSSSSSVSDYLVLHPNQASSSDLFRCLWSNKRRDFLDQSNGPEAPDLRKISYRWIVFVSLTGQKFMGWIQKPMALMGNSLQLWLNLVHSNGGLSNLFFNFIKGSVVWPDKSSSTYRSVAGCLDSRIDIDEMMMSQSRYLPQLCIMASKLSYESSGFVENVVMNKWKMKFLGFYDFWNDFESRTTTQAFMFNDTSNNLTVIAFRGTEPFDAHDWCTDMDISWYQLNNSPFHIGGKVHAGFMKALGLQKNTTGWPNEITDLNNQFAYYTLRDNLKSNGSSSSNYILTGHSLGGALAVLFVALLVLHNEEDLLQRLEGVYTFGQPRVGDEEFGKYMKGILKKYNIRYERYVYCNDMVPRMPYDDALMLFKHFGPCVYFNSLYTGQILPEEPNRNYLSLVWVIPKYLNAWWELIRGRTYLPWFKGSYYKENWFLTFYRVIGLIIPGLTAHGLQDYQNLTTLGTILVDDRSSHVDKSE